MSTAPPLPAQEVPDILFSTIDYVLFSTMLGLSAVIGIYFGCFGSKQSSKNEYLLGGKTMKVFPVAMSLIASNLSGIAILSVPVDIYKYGSIYWWICISLTVTSLAAYYIYMPVFMKLQVTSAYEYLQLRFDRRIRTLASFIFTLSVFLFNPIVIYIPALAFAQATGVDLHLITPIVCVICIFYTTIGGLKAVVWTDTLQTASIVICIMVVFVMGMASAGGFIAVWEKSVEGHRLDLFDFDIDPTKRNSVWALVIGSSAGVISYFCIHQGTVQRFLSVPSIDHAKRVIIIFWVGMLIVKTISVFTGLIIYTKYSDCDPITSKQILRSDQLLPYYVMDVAGKVPGLPGLFIAGVFSAGLSTLSTTLNTLSATIYEDFVSRLLPSDISQKRASNILKLIVILSGASCTALVFVVEHLGGILPLAVSISGISGGPLLGLFTLGMLFPVANSKGALCGGTGGLIFASWMVFGNQWYKQKGMIPDTTLPVSIEGCNFLVNVTLIEKPSPIPEDLPFVLYRITFWYFTLFGTIVTIAIGLAVSWFTCKNDPPVHPDLISPVAHFLLPKSQRSTPPPIYHSVDKALHLVTKNSDGDVNEQDQDRRQ